MKLYLYTSVETALNIIKTSTLALSSPKSFNDPFDCLPLWSDEDLHKAIDVFNGYIIEQTLFDLIEQKAKSIHSISQKLIVSIVLAEYKLLKKLARKKPGAYDPYYKTDRVKKLLNSAIRFSKSKEELVQIKRKFEAELPNLLEKEEEKFKQIFTIRDSIYVGCLSERYDSILMWSYYADKHKGACIEFEIEDDPVHLFKVEYTDYRPQIQAEKFAKEYCGRLLSSAKQDQLIKDPILLKMIAQPYITKSTQWQHEKEYRFVFTEKELIDKNVEKRLFDCGTERYMYPINKINMVYMGAMTSEENTSAIAQNAHEKGIEVKRLMISDEHYTLIPGEV